MGRLAEAYIFEVEKKAESNTSQSGRKSTKPKAKAQGESPNPPGLNPDKDGSRRMMDRIAQHAALYRMACSALRNID